MDMAAAAALTDVNQSLLWIGFVVQGQQDSIIEEPGFMSLSSFIDVFKQIWQLQQHLQM